MCHLQVKNANPCQKVNNSKIMNSDHDAAISSGPSVRDKSVLDG